MKYFFIVKLTFILVCSSAFLHGGALDFNAADIEKIKAMPDRDVISNRILNFQTLLLSLQGEDKEKILNRINTHVNRINPRYDIINGTMNDVWYTPKEFLITGKGDCEDYAILKYFSLIELGFNKEDLYLDVVQVGKRIDKHMVLLYFDRNKNEHYVLDNLSTKILPLEKRKDLTSFAIFNEFEFESMNTLENRMLPINKNYIKDTWKKLLERVK